MKGIFLPLKDLSTLAIISLGGNKGNVLSLFNSAVQALQTVGIIEKISSIYETEPWGVTEQDWFKNQVLGLRTKLSSDELMSFLLEVESKHGRNRKTEERWGARSLDLDILFFGDKIYASKHLEIPHPRLHKRRFILEPLTEIYPALLHPKLKQSAKQLLEKCVDTSKTQLVNAV